MVGKFETNKDLVQELTSSGARHVGKIATIITGTVSEVTHEIGEWITDAIEMREAAAAARQDAAAARQDEHAAGEDGPDTHPREATDPTRPRADVRYEGSSSATENGAAQPIIDADVEYIDPHE
ncbi:MAG: hypothetical protein J2P18_17945 [Nocardia sp.]|nr:hypothetical protein [Nocardia sp.]